MRFSINLLKTFFYSIFLVIVAAWLVVVALTHYQGEAAALELLRLETAPIGQDPLVGWLFETVSADASLVHWVAASMTAGIIIIGWLATHHLIAIIRLAADARSYIQSNQGSALARTIAAHAIALLLAGIPLLVLLNADADLFQHRGLAGHFGVDDPATAARVVPSMEAMPSGSFNLGDVAFFAGVGWWLSIVLGVTPAIAMELVGARLFELIALVAEDMTDLFRRLSGEEAQHPGIEVGQRESDTPAWSASPNPADRPDTQQTIPEEEAAGSPETSPANDDQPDEVVADDDDTVEVIGGTPGERVRFADALANPERFHVNRRPRQVFDRDYHDQLEAGSEADPDVDPIAKRESTR